jgi:hypothetical protein
LPGQVRPDFPDPVKRTYAPDRREVADVKTARLVYTVRNGKIVRYELENLDEPEVTDAPAH